MKAFELPNKWQSPSVQGFQKDMYDGAQENRLAGRIRGNKDNPRGLLVVSTALLKDRELKPKYISQELIDFRMGTQPKEDIGLCGE